MNRKLVLVSLFVLSFLLITGINWQGWAAPLGQEGTPTEEPQPARPIFGLDADPAPFLEGDSDPEPRAPDAPTIDVPWSKIAFNSYRDGNYEIYLADGTGNNQTRLTWDGSSDMTPRLNRGCTKLVFSSNRTGNYEIFTMNVDSSGLTQLTTNSSTDSFPVWSPDGTRIAFQSYRDNQYEIYVMNADGSGQTRLTWDGDYDGQPAWSPDGNKIAFVSRRTGGYRVYVMNVDSSGLVQLSNQAYSFHPVWSPDGSQIAYDADGDGDGWQELWLTGIDGWNQYPVYKPVGTSMDAWAGGWSPDGQFVTLTEITWVYYQGNWYWQYAYALAWNTVIKTTGITNSSEDWYPDWQTMDTLPPVTSIAPLPVQSPGPFIVRWSGVDSQSGVSGYDVQVRDGIGGMWTDWLIKTTATGGFYQGIGGHTYYFRERGWDYGGNVEPWAIDYETYTHVESDTPISFVKTQNAFLRNGNVIEWEGKDMGGSAIQGYDVQYRDEEGDIWVDWLMSTSATWGEFTGIPGHTYHFRTRAIDTAGNLENWPIGNGETSITLYAWGISGRVMDQVGVPIANVSITTTPSVSLAFPSDIQGMYGAYSLNDNSLDYSAIWHKTGYGALPLTHYSSQEDPKIDIILPPRDDLVQNGGFESTGLLPSWSLGGTYTPIKTEIQHTGQFAVSLGYPPIGWGDIVRITNMDGWSSGQDVGIDNEGNIHVVWRSAYSSEFQILYAMRGVNGSWSLPVNIFDSSLGVEDPKLNIAPDGIVHVIFATSDHQVIYTWRDHSGVWANPYSISGINSDDPGPQLVIDSRGIVHVIWRVVDYPNADYLYSQRDSSGVWSTPVNIIRTPVPTYSVQLVLDTNDNLHFIWIDRSNVMGEYRVYYSERTDGIWMAPQDISGALAYNASIAVDNSGLVHVIWTQDDEGSVYYSRKDLAGNWSTPLRISELGVWSASSGSYIDVYVSPNGEVHTLWYQGSSPESVNLYHAMRSINGSWTNPENFSQHTDIKVLGNANGSLDNLGKLHVVWSAGDDYSLNIFYTEQSDDGAWLEPQNLTNSSSSYLYPSLIIDARCQPNILWAEYYTDDNVEINYLGPKTAPYSGSSELAQAITIPEQMTTPVLSFLYKLDVPDPIGESGLEVSISDGLTTTPLFETSHNTADWTHAWFDLSPWRGQTITLIFEVHEVENYPYAWAFLDDVTIGSANPDIWISSYRAAALPGEQVNFTITYGNRGGADAISSTITATLPAGLIFESASISSTLVGDTLSWDVGSLPSGSGPFTILITATVAPTATLGSTLTGSAEIATTTPEIETANNIFQFEVFIGQKVYLPMVMKDY